MHDEKDKDLILLGEFELVGRNLGQERQATELVFHPKSFTVTAIDAMRFDRLARSSIVIRDRKLAKSLKDEEVFEILLRRVGE